MKKCKDCGKRTKGFGKRCYSCAQKERLKNLKYPPNYKDGRCSETYYCKVCEKEITIFSGFYGKRKCLSCAKYIHGQGYAPYSIKFNNQLKLKIRQRDHYKCQICRMTEKKHIIVYGRVIEIHHIDYNKQNCEENNLITTCKQCNLRANKNRDYWYAYFMYITN